MSPLASMTAISLAVSFVSSTTEPSRKMTGAFGIRLEKELKRLKWNLWHGNVHKALQIVEDLEYALDLEENSQEQRKLLKAVR
jgi:hypothetical protein